MLRAHQFIKPILIYASFLAIAGCTATPLYQAAQTPGAVDAIYAQSISFDAPGNRVEQVVRNKLIFRVYGGKGEPAGADFKGTLSVRADSSSIFRTTTTSVGQTSAGLITVTGTLTVVNTKTGEFIAEYKRSAIAPIDRSNQQFANERALLDAENRAAEELGEQFATLLASRVLR